MVAIKEKISLYCGIEDMEEKLALCNDCLVYMSEKFDGHYVTIVNDGISIRIISAGGLMFKYCLGLEAMPHFPPGVELRAELVLQTDIAKSSYQQYLDTNAFFSHCYLKDNEENPYDDFRALQEWNSCNKHMVPCKILLHVHGLVSHRHDLNTEKVAEYLQDADQNIRQIEWTLVTSVDQAKQRLQAMFEADKEGLIFFVQELEPAPGTLGCGKSDADSRSCSPEPPAQASRKVVGSKWIKGKLRLSFKGTVVMAGRHNGRLRYTVILKDGPLKFAEVKVHLGNTHGFDGIEDVRVDVIPNSNSDRRSRHAIGMGIYGDSAKRKRH